jgi:hypothetical protein
MKVYASVAKRRERLSGAYRDGFDQALQWALMGATGPSEPVEALESAEAEVADPASPSYN